MFDIGIVVKPQGIRGELRVLPTTDDPTRFALLDEVFLQRKNAASVEKFTLLSSRLQKGVVILTFAEVTDRSTAEALVGAVLQIPDEWALPLDTDEYYVRDLIGCTAADENGGILGEITQVLSTGANDVYIIRAEGDAFMVPAIKDVVRAVDLPARRVTLRLMEGMRELRTQS